MVPNYPMHEHLMFERHQEWQREMAELRLVAGVRRPHFRVVPRLAAQLGVFLVALGTRMRRLEPSRKQVVYDPRNSEETQTAAT
jgi:hypothetical protein